MRAVQCCSSWLALLWGILLKDQGGRSPGLFYALHGKNGDAVNEPRLISKSVNSCLKYFTFTPFSSPLYVKTLITL